MPIFKPADSVALATRAKSIQRGTSSGPRLKIEDFIVQRASGFLASADLHFLPRLSERLREPQRLTSAVDALGEWMAIATRNHRGEGPEHLILSDSYGYMPVFYAIVEGRFLIVSDSFRGAIYALSQCGVDRTLDMDTYVTAICGSGSQFENSASHRTMAREISILPVDKALLVQTDSVAIIDRPGILNSPANHSASDLMELGENASITALESTLRITEGRNVIKLSGGVDSRLSLAHIARTGKLTKVEVSSQDPRKWNQAQTKDLIERDIDIANAIRDSYGMSWNYGGPRQGMSVGFIEFLHYFQSHSSNYHFGLRPAATISGHSMPTAVIRGGGGELLRTTSAGRILASEYNGGSNSAQTSERETEDTWIAQRLASAAPVAEPFRERIRNLVSESFSKVPGDSFEERMNGFYFAHRNRAHFGQASRYIAANEIPLQLLSNPYYMKAARGVPYKQRSEGVFVKALFERLQPKLLDFPFESSEWDRLLSTNAQTVAYGRQHWAASYDQKPSPNTPVDYLRGWNPGARKEQASAFRPTTQGNYLQLARHLLEEVASPSEVAELQELHDQIIPQAKRRSDRLGRAIASMASAIDVFFPVPLGGNVSFEEPAELQSSTSDDYGITAGTLSVPRDGWSNVEIPGTLPVLYIQENVICASAQPYGLLTPDAKYAFYLKRDGKIVERIPYQSLSVASFASQLQPGQYSVTAFLRPEGDSGPTVWQESTLVHLNLSMLHSVEGKSSNL